MCCSGGKGIRIEGEEREAIGQNGYRQKRCQVQGQEKHCNSIIFSWSVGRKLKNLKHVESMCSHIQYFKHTEKKDNQIIVKKII